MTDVDVARRVLEMGAEIERLLEENRALKESLAAVQRVIDSQYIAMGVTNAT